MYHSCLSPTQQSHGINAAKNPLRPLIFTPPLQTSNDNGENSAGTAPTDEERRQQLMMECPHRCIPPLVPLRKKTGDRMASSPLSETKLNEIEKRERGADEKQKKRRHCGTLRTWCGRSCATRVPCPVYTFTSSRRLQPHLDKVPYSLGQLCTTGRNRCISRTSQCAVVRDAICYYCV